jgi:hypothetical protein
MKSRKLRELYGHRFTPSARIAAIIMIVITGVLTVFCQSNEDLGIEKIRVIEQSVDTSMSRDI